MKSPKIRFQYRKARVREVVHGTAERPRLSVFRSLKFVYAQAIDDVAGKTLAAASSLESAVKGKSKSAANIASAKQVGALVAERLVQAKVKKVVFDRGGRLYHGVVKAVAEGAREKGLEF